MPLTAIEGVVENGRIRLRENVSLPENTRVVVIVGAAGSLVGPTASVRSPRLARPEQAGDFRKHIVEPPADAGV